MKKYMVKLLSDSGPVMFHLYADSIDSARQTVATAENAPLSSIQFAGVVPTKKQIKKTKSLMRGI